MQLSSGDWSRQKFLRLCRNPRRVFQVRGYRYLLAPAKRGEIGAAIPPLQELHWLFYVGGTRAPRVLYRRRD